jgi:dipeptidyl aminopeptidase/acylaminoacyl peptidase
MGTQSLIQKDIRDTFLFREAEAFHQSVRQPGTGQISDASEICAAPSEKLAVFAGTIVDRSGNATQTRICQVDLSSGDTRVLTFGPNTDRSPKYSPGGGHIAFLSDRHKVGDFQLHLLGSVSGAARAVARVEGWIEYLHWSPDGRRILLGVAHHGADVSGGQGAISSSSSSESPPWMPTVEGADQGRHCRSSWVYDLATDRVRQVGEADCNVWEATWCGNEALVAVVSSGAEEGAWYGAHLRVVEIETATSREIYSPKAQLGWPASSMSGTYVAIVEAICSDRGIVAGDLKLIETASGKAWEVDTGGVDIACTEWLSDRLLLLAGHRGFESIVGLYDMLSETFTVIWESHDVTTGGRYATVSPLNKTGDCVLVSEGFLQAPAVGVIRRGRYESVKSFDLGYVDYAQWIRAIERVRWPAPDGLEIQGWLLRPKEPGPRPLVMCVHGGPVWHWRPFWLGRAAFVMMLISRGYAIFLPNPRGSVGRGQDFVRPVLGDMGGADTHDLLSGIDHLVAQGVADPKRLGVTGGSYGGFMTSWLITQDDRFAAAVSVAPVTNHVTEHLTSNIPHFVDIFLNDSYTNLAGRYFARSPVMHANKARTPTLNICGALDRCTPVQEGIQFHNALRESGVKSVLVIYPQEGHGIRQFPACIDYAARLVGWFDQHLRPGIA